MNRKMKKGAAWRHVRGFAIGVAVGGAVLGAMLAQPVLRTFLTGEMAADGLGRFMFYWCAAMLLFVAVLFVQVVIHEAGHLVCGLATGYRFVSFRVGSLMLFRDCEGWHLGRFNVAGTGGQCLLAPPSDDIASAATMPCKAYCMGGVAANLLVAAAAVMVLAVCRTGVLCTYVLTAAALTGLMLGAMNGVPMCLGGVPNDGRNMSTVNRDPDMRRMLWLQLEINALYSRGRMLRDMPDDWFRLPAGADLANPMYAAIAGFDAARCVELRDFEGARERMEALRSQSGVIGLFRTEAACEMVFLAVVQRRPRCEIEALFQPDAERYARACSRYMIGRAFTLYVWERFVRRDGAKAAGEAARIRSMARRYPVRGEARATLELLEWTETLDDDDYGVD